MKIEPLNKQIYDKAKELGVEKIELRFEGGSDEGYLSIDIYPEESDKDGLAGIIEDWAWEVYDYNGAGDGNDYGDIITYNLKEGKATTSEWYMARVDEEEDFCDLEIAEEEQEEEN
jgi:hypothetical protein